jgi:hypothetical protein
MTYRHGGNLMNEDTLNIQIRKFLKKVGVTSQREIEKGVQDALETGRIKGDEKLASVMTLEIPALNLKLRIDGEILMEK